MEEVVLIRIELITFNTEQAQYATKADVKASEANMKGWMLAVALPTMTVTSP